MPDRKILSERLIYVSSHTRLLFWTKVDTEVTQWFLVSVTSYFVCMDYMLIPGTFDYADDSTVVHRYLYNARARIEEIRCFESLWLFVWIWRVRQWSLPNLSIQNCKAQACWFSTKRNHFVLTPTLCIIFLPILNRLQLLGIESFGERATATTSTGDFRFNVVSLATPLVLEMSMGDEDLLHKVAWLLICLVTKSSFEFHYSKIFDFKRSGVIRLS